MVLTFQILLLLLLVAAWVVMCVVLVRVLRGAAKRRLYAEARYALCDGIDGVGISLLYSGAGEWGSMARLLDVDYERCERVLVVDARRDQEAFADLVARYALFGVCHTLDEELPVEGVRGLYRSRKRCFRRLVVVDKNFTSVATDLDAAAAVAAYDYLLPMRHGWQLMPDAVGRLAAELSECSVGAVDLVRSMMGIQAMLISREVVLASGGFSRRPWRAVPRHRRRRVYEPILCPEHPPLREGLGRCFVCALLLAVGIGAAALLGWWLLCALLLTVAVLWAAVCVYSLVCSCSMSQPAQLPEHPASRQPSSPAASSRDS